MKIANPLYDHAFKYMMSNDRIARKVLSTILDEEVVELDLMQQEVLVENKIRLFTLYRLDFKATVVQADGTRRKILIELQKSKLPTNVLRFRNYLSHAYRENGYRRKKRSESAAVVTANDELAVAESEALPIVAIYILGYNLADIPVMAARVDNQVVDASTNEVLDLESNFIDLLTHRCYVLQVRRLPKKRRTRIEQFMTLFNQAWISEEDYILDLDMDEVPEEFRDVARYLRRPLQDEDIRMRLEAEEEFEDMIAYHEAKAEAAEAKADEAEAKANAAEAKANAAEAKANEAEAKANATKAKAQEEVRQVSIMLARVLKQTGLSDSEVAAQTGLSQSDIENL